MIQLVNYNNLQFRCETDWFISFSKPTLVQRPNPFHMQTHKKKQGTAEEQQASTKNTATSHSHTCIAELCPCIHAAPSWQSQLLRHQWWSWQKGNNGQFIKGTHKLRLDYQETHVEAGFSTDAWRSVLLCCLGKDGCEEGLFICPRWGDAGSDPVGPIWRFADRVRVGDQRLTFIRVLEQVNQNINKW